MNFEHSSTQTISACGFQSDPALQLITQIQSLVNHPGFILQTPGRSPLFLIAEHLAIPAPTHHSNPKRAVTDKNFADVRQEALKSGRIKSSARAKIANRKSGSAQGFQF
jgi:hypothetical protein